MAKGDNYIELLKRLYLDEQMSLAQISNELGLETSIIRHALRKAGIQLRPSIAQARETFTKNILEEEYVKKGKSMSQIASEMNCSESHVWYEMKRFSVSARSRSDALKGRTRSPEHKEALSKAARKIDKKGKNNPNWRGGKEITCLNCGKQFHVIPRRQKTAKFCSRQCKGHWMRKNLTADNHPNWHMDRPKIRYCQQCGAELKQKKTEAISTFRKRKFCSKTCADIGGVRYEGSAHPCYKADARRRSKRGKHGAWARAVISRDNGICQRCGASNVEIHAHHIRSFADYPDKRWDVNNGVTLCYKCHWEVHELRVIGDEILGEPKLGVTKGKQSRRWEGKCEWCGVFISKPWGQSKNRAHHFCSRSCAQKYRLQHLTEETRKKMSDAQKLASRSSRGEGRGRSLISK